MRQIITLEVESDGGVARVVQNDSEHSLSLCLTGKGPFGGRSIKLISHQVEDQPDTDPAIIKDMKEDNLPYAI